MRHLLAILCLSLCACGRTSSSTLAVRGASLVDVVTGSLLPSQTVLVDSNRIVMVGPTDQVRIPNGAEVVEAGGGYLIPGLWDMHVHSVMDTPHHAIAAQDWHFPLFLAFGVTGVRNMGDGTDDVTLELSKSIRRRLTARELQGPPRFLTAGPAVDGDPPLGGTTKVVVHTEAEARAAVAALDSSGADLIKVYENLSREAYFAIQDEARHRKIPVDGHLPFRITPEEGAAAGQRTFEHPEALAAGCATDAGAERKRFAEALAGYHGESRSEQLLVMMVRHYRALYDSRDTVACRSAFEMYRRRGMAVTTDLLVYYFIVHAKQLLADSSRMRLVPEPIRREWVGMLNSATARELQSMLQPVPALELANVRLAREAGVVLLAATDVDIPLGIPGLSIHEELLRLVDAGLTPLEALQAATLNPVRVLGLADSLGTIEPGKLADLVLLDANPLDDIHNTQRIRAVVADGRLYRRADLDRLAELARGAGSRVPLQ
jgi:Amidohydrolase family